MDCPICKRAVNKSGPEFPFCSERCRNEDLANWVYGRYRAPAPMSDAEEFPGVNAERESGKKNGE